MKRPSKVSSCPWEKGKSQLDEGEWEGVSNICVSLTGQRRCHHVRSSHGRDPEQSQEFTIEISLDSWNLINFYLFSPPSHSPGSGASHLTCSPR